MNTYVHPVGGETTSKKHLRRPFSSLVRRIQSGMSLALLGFAPTIQRETSWQKPAFRARSPVLDLGCGTVSADNDPAAEEQGSSSRASQKHTAVFNFAAPPGSVNFFVEATSISSVYPNESLGRAL
jgi:hypothetical protein